MAEHEYGNLSTLLADHQGLLHKGDLIRVLTGTGSWGEFEVHSKSRDGWVNVSNPGQPKPTHSTKLVPGGRWYKVDSSGVRVGYLEGDDEPPLKQEANCPSVPIPTSQPTILSVGDLEAGGDLATQVDRDNTDYFSQIIEPTRDTGVDDDLDNLIDRMHTRYSNLQGFDNLGDGMYLLRDNLIELLGVSREDPHSNIKISQAELKEARLIEYLKRQMSSINQPEKVEAEVLHSLDADFFAFIEAYRTQKIHLIQSLGRVDGQSKTSAHQPNPDLDNPFPESRDTTNGKKTIIAPNINTENGSNMSLDDMDGGYIEVDNFPAQTTKSGQGDQNKTIADRTPSFPTPEDRLTTLEQDLKSERERWDQEAERTIKEIQRLQLENESLRNAQLTRDKQNREKVDETNEIMSKHNETLMKYLQLMKEEREAERAHREAFHTELRTEMSLHKDMIQQQRNASALKQAPDELEEKHNSTTTGRRKDVANLKKQNLNSWNDISQPKYKSTGQTRYSSDAYVDPQSSNLFLMYEAKINSLQNRLMDLEEEKGHRKPKINDIEHQIRACVQKELIALQPPKTGPPLIIRQQTQTTSKPVEPQVQEPITKGKDDWIEQTEVKPHESLRVERRPQTQSMEYMPQPHTRVMTGIPGGKVWKGPMGARSLSPPNFSEDHDDLLDVELPDNPFDHNHSTTDSVLQGSLEELEELSSNVGKLIKSTKKVLQEGHDGKIKSHKSTISRQFERLSELSRRCRNTFKKEARARLTARKAAEMIMNPSIARNLELIRELEQLIDQVDDKIEARGLDLIQNGSSSDVKVVWPTFSGSDLPLIHTFLTEIESLMVDSGIPVSRRGTILAQSVKGEAKTILTNCDLSKNPSFESQAAVLLAHFGQTGSQVSLLTRLHQNHGKIPTIGDESQPVFRIYTIVKGHLRLLRAAKDLQEKFSKGDLPENPISSCYLNTIEDFLPRDSVNRLTDIEGYVSTLPTDARFQLLLKAYKSLQTWASSMIAKHGIEEAGAEPKKRARGSPQTSLMATTSTGNRPGNEQLKAVASNQNPPFTQPQFQGSPPAPPLALLPLPTPSTTSICFYCKRPGHWASNCPSKVGGVSPSQTTYNGQTISLTPFGDGQRFLKADLLCFICNTLPNTSDNGPRPHIFTKHGRLERFLCPKISSLNSIEERSDMLRQHNICPACLNGVLSDDRHKGEICKVLEYPNMQVLKCHHVGCRRRWALCVTHKKDNSQKLTNYKESVQKHLQMNLSLITTVSLGEGCSEPNVPPMENVNLNSNLDVLPPRVYSEIQELIHSAKTPILHVNENSYSFMLYLMQGKTQETPVVICFDTGSAFTLIREDVLEQKIRGPIVKLPGSSSVIGIGGKQSADNYYCSIALEADEAEGFSSKIVSCLSVKQIVDIDTMDTTKLVRYLKKNYQDQLPEDFDLYNFGTLGSRIKLDALVGIQELNIWPKLIFRTPCGLCIFRVPISPAEGVAPYCVGGTLPDLSDEEDSEESIPKTLVSSFETETLNVESIKEALDTNLRDPHFIDIMDEECRSTLLALFNNELNDEQDKKDQPTMLTRSSPDMQDNGNSGAIEEARRIKPSYVISSPIPDVVTESLSELQEQMMQSHPSLSEFVIPRTSFHITHLVLGESDSISQFGNDLRKELLEPHIWNDLKVELGRMTAFNGNLCIILECPNVVRIQDIMKKHCRKHNIYFDPVQTYHITLFKKNYKANSSPDLHPDELMKLHLPALQFQIKCIDFCKMKRADKSKYFDIIERATSQRLQPKNTPSAGPNTENKCISKADEHQPDVKGNVPSILQEGMANLCTEHRTLLNITLPLLDDWLSIESVASIIKNVYQPFDPSPHKNTIPQELSHLCQGKELYDQLPTSKAICMGSVKPKDDKVRNLLDESVTNFRCLSCKLCSSCSRSNLGGGTTLTLRSEVENLLIKNSVSIDLRTNRIVAKHVLPTNFKELLGDNRKECERRLRNQLIKLSKRPEEERSQVLQSIKKLITRGFVCTKEEFTEEELKMVEENEGQYVLPVSIVFKSSSISTPSRVCLDGSAKTNTGYGLNCLLPKGALSLSIGSLVQVWKAFPVVASGDLSSFYCRFSLDCSHWGLQKFFWVDDLDPNGPITTYYVKTIIFGIRSSGLVCHYGLSKLVEVYECLKALVFYVDDAIAHFYDMDHARTEIKKMADILRKYNLPFKSDRLSLLGEEPSKEVVNEFGEIAISTAKWNPLTDMFRCSVPILFLGQADRGSLAKVNICHGTSAEEIFEWLPDNFTLKDLLSKTASHFDSQLGILVGLIAPMRQLVRRVMIESRGDGTQTNWDYVLPPHHRRQFAHQLAEAKKVGEFLYPRFPKGSSPILPNHKGILVCFSDAADFETAVIYLGLPQADGKWRFNLITARSYLIQNGMTIAKSELQAAGHGANAVQSVIDNFAERLTLEPYLLIDSQCVMHWVANCDSLLHTFHRNRVLAIASVFGKNVYYIKSKLNIADDISREDVTAQNVAPSSRMYLGPSFLEDGIDTAHSTGTLTSLSDLSKENMTPELLENFKSGVILSKFQDLNFMTLKRHVNDEQSNMETRTDPTDGVNHPTVSSAVSLMSTVTPCDEKEPFCTACQMTVSPTSAKIFYSECDPGTGQHAFGCLSGKEGSKITSPKPSLSLVSQGNDHVSLLCQKRINELIVTRNTAAKNSCNLPTPLLEPHPTQGDDDAEESAGDNFLPLNESSKNLWSQTTRDMALKIDYLINPVGLPLPRLCRAGAIALRFIYLLLSSNSQRKTSKRMADIKNRLFSSPASIQRISLVLTIKDLTCLDNVSSDNVWHPRTTRPLAASETDSEIKDASHDPTMSRSITLSQSSKPLTDTDLLILGDAICDLGWMKYPGIRKSRRTFTKWLELVKGDYQHEKIMEYQETAVGLKDFGQLVQSLCETCCRQPVRNLGAYLVEDLITVLSISKSHRGFKALPSIRGYPLPTGSPKLRQQKPPLDKCPTDVNFVQMMQGSYSLSHEFVNLIFFHLVRQEQNFIRSHWPAKRRSRYCLSDQGIMVFNTRMTEHVHQQSSVLSTDPDAINFSQTIPGLECPVLDKNSPLYISIARYIHCCLDLPEQPSAGLFQKHRGASQNHMMSLRFSFAPGGLSTFKRIQNCCFICQVRMKKFVRTSEGGVHHAQLTFVKPFQSAHIDLMGPLIMKVHHSSSTRKNANERKAWLLVTVCSFTRAIWTELMLGTSAADFSDALTRTMSITGSITHMVTDRLATQLKVLREGKFVEQIKYMMYKRHGWHFEAIPVSKHKWNGMVEGRIASLREMLACPDNKIPMTILNFQTHLRVATSLLNAVPFAYSFEGGSAQSELKILSPSAFLYPLNSLHRPILSPITLDKGEGGYFQTIKECYQLMVEKFMDAAVPIIAKKYHKHYMTPGHEIAEDDIVLFKKRPGATFLPGWSLGRVIKIKKARDNTIRSIQVVYIHNQKSDQEEDPYVTGMEDKRTRVDRHLSRIETIRETDEVIKLYPVDPQEDDMYQALDKIVSAVRASQNSKHR